MACKSKKWNPVKLCVGVGIPVTCGEAKGQVAAGATYACPIDGKTRSSRLCSVPA